MKIAVRVLLDSVSFSRIIAVRPAQWLALTAQLLYRSFGSLSIPFFNFFRRFLKLFHPFPKFPAPSPSFFLALARKNSPAQRAGPSVRIPALFFCERSRLLTGDPSKGRRNAQHRAGARVSRSKNWPEAHSPAAHRPGIAFPSVFSTSAFVLVSKPPKPATVARIWGFAPSPHQRAFRTFTAAFASSPFGNLRSQILRFS